MSRVVVAGLVVALAGAPRVAADDGGAGICARCHATQVAQTGATGGHAPTLGCTSCHADRRPNRFGRGHRARARCADCHAETRHPPREGRAHATRRCLVCHDVHGSANLALVRPALRVGDRLADVRLESESGAAPGGFTDPTAPGTGLCEVCHRRTEVYRADGHGTPHFTDSCVLCHAHGAGFEVVVSEQNCSICHAAEAARLAKPSLHHDRFLCGDCHAEAAAAPGPGHRTTPACADCHDDRRTHAPPGRAAFACTQCHDPHGTDNTELVLEAITTPAGETRPIRFDNLLGRADGSFASASAPGTGVCEICHTATRYYRADGGGASHFTFSCLPCHRHAAGFDPQ